MEEEGINAVYSLNFNAICKKNPHDLLYSIISHAEFNSIILIIQYLPLGAR